MARYLVHVKGEGGEALAGARFVRDGFAWSALSFGPLWFLAKGAWISACLGFALLIGFVGMAIGLRLPEGATLFGLALINLLLALESGALRSWELNLRGYRDVGIVAGNDPDTLEQRFFADNLATPVPLPDTLSSGTRSSASVPVIGLFPSPFRGGNP